MYAFISVTEWIIYMKNLQTNRDDLYVYRNIFSNIIKEICPTIAPFLHITIETDQNKSKNNDLSHQKNRQWHKTQNIHDRNFSLTVWIDNEKEFDEIMSTGYQENGHYVILDMLITRILDEIILLLKENAEESSIHINYTKDTMDLLNQAVMDFAYYIEIPILHGINYISSMPYESSPCDGRIVFIKDALEAENAIIELESKILFHKKNYRIIRKILQVARKNKYAVYDMSQAQIIGLVSEQSPLILQNNSFILEFRGHMHWVLRYKQVEAIQYLNGTYHIFEDIGSPRDYLKDLKIYYNNDNNKVNRALQLIRSVSQQSHGTMVIISSNVEKEVNRLSQNNRAIKIKPINLIKNSEWIYSITSIDGALMLDEDLNCYSIGTLLDGPSAIGDISRGARYNSAMSYVHWRAKEEHEKVLAVIVSEDKIISTIVE